jgi:DNA repair exonuclease SbcCD nuclease subunit
VRIAILSDFHLGYERFREDALRQAGEALSAAADKADVLLIPGDIFDNREPSPDVLAEGINLFRDLSKREWHARVSEFRGEGRTFTDVPIVAIPGTHERRAEGIEDPVDLLGLAGLLVDTTNACAIVERGGERVAIRGLGGIAEDRFKEIMKREDPKPIEGMFNIFFFHQSIYEFLPFSQDFIKLDDLPDGFDLYVDGHIHGRIESSSHGKPLLIPGSTVLTQLKDGEQETKGFYVFDTLTKSYVFNEIGSRRFVLRRVSIEGKEPSEVTDDIESVVSAEAGKGGNPIVKIELVGKLKAGYKGIEINSPEIVKHNSGKAIVEIGKDKIEAGQASAQGGLGEKMADGVSIKDYGLGIFLEKVRNNGYDLKKSPIELFEDLSVGETKEKVVKRVMDDLLS